MNKQEAIAELKRMASTIEWDYPLDAQIAIEKAVEALSGPQPDPETGLVPCGCGGKAIPARLPHPIKTLTCVACETCFVTTPYLEDDEAKDVWNRAMGWKGGAECGTDGANIIRHISGKMRIDIPPGNDSVRASTGFQRDGGDKTERRCNQCVICGAEMPEGDQVCGYCRRKHGY